MSDAPPSDQPPEPAPRDAHPAPTPAPGAPPPDPTPAPPADAASPAATAAPRAATAAAAPVAGPPSATRSWFWCVLFLALGIALRVFVALDADAPGAPAVPPWETESLLRSLEAPSWPDLNGLRPAGLVALHDRVGELAGVADVDGARRLGVGVSLLGLLSLLLGSWCLAARLGFPRRRWTPLAAGIAALWALHPSGLLAARAPTPDAWLAALAPLALVGWAAAAGARPWLGAVLLGLVGGGLLALGGVLWAVALVVGVLGFLLPVPRPAGALRALTVLTLAVAVWAAAEGVDGARADVRPDAAWSYAALDALFPEHPRFKDMAWPVERRHAEVRGLVLDMLGRRGTSELLGQLAQRVLQLGFAPARFELLASQVAAHGDVALQEPVRLGLGWLDILWRGGCLLFACTVLGLFRTREESTGWPRVGVCLGVATLALLSVTLATSPLALYPVDALLIACAGAGLAGADARRRRTRQLAFVLGGLLMLSFTYVCGLGDRPLDGLLWDRGERWDQGTRLLALLSSPEELTLDDQIQVGAFYLDDDSPYLRQPELATAHAVEATHLDPDSESALMLLVRAMAAKGFYKEAARVAHDAYEAGGRSSKRVQVLLHWVQDLERRDRPPAVR